MGLVPQPPGRIEGGLCLGQRRRNGADGLTGALHGYYLREM